MALRPAFLWGGNGGISLNYRDERKVVKYPGQILSGYTAEIILEETSEADIVEELHKSSS